MAVKIQGIPRPLDLTVVLHAAGICGLQRTTKRHTWVCLRPHHGGEHTHQDAYRRRHGRTPSADKHVFVTIDSDRIPL